MPDRVIRNELLTSERYWSVSIQAQQFYIHLLLVADDAARISGKNFTLRSSCFPGRPMDAQHLEKMLTELVDVDLIRAYMIDSERYLFVPRFRNRRRYVASSKYPEPPNEINDLAPEKADSSQPQVIPESSSSQPQVRRRGVGVGVGVGVGENLSTPKGVSPRKRGSSGSDGFDLFWQAYPRKEAKPAALKAFTKLGPSVELLDEMLQAIAQQRTGKQWSEGFIPHPSTWINNKRWTDQPTDMPTTRHETPRQAAAIDRAIEMSGGLLNARRSRQPDYIDATTDFPSLG